MTVIVTENVPPRLRGRLRIWMLELRAGVFVGNFSKKHRDHVWMTVVEQVTVHHGSAVIAWATSTNETGFQFDTVGENRRIVRRMDGVSLVSFLSQDQFKGELPADPPPPPDDEPSKPPTRRRRFTPK